MKKAIYGLVLIALLGLGGCKTNLFTPKTTDACRNVPSVWWGEKGQSPAENDLWKCYDWILQRR